MSKITRLVIYSTVFMTGLFSLVYQTAWQRYLTFLVGADSRSSTLTLTVFLTALSIGYYLAGRMSDRIKTKELLYYGLIEILIGLWAIAFPLLFQLSISLIETGYLNHLFGDVVFSIALIAIPATLMGTTLPFLTQGLSRSFQSSSQTHASIYAINTIGACLGSLLAGFMLIELIGLAKSLYFIGALNIGFGLLMITINNRMQFKSIKEAARTDSLPPQIGMPIINQKALLLVAACSGYLLIAIESYFIRLFSMATDGSIYAYPTVVTAFIAAVGIGAALSSRLMAYALKLYAVIPIIVLLLWIGIYATIPYWPYADYLIKHQTIGLFGHYDWLPFIRFLALFGVILLPVIASSMLLPFSFHFFKNKNTNLGQSTGNLYAIATIATIFGGLIGGFYLFNLLNFQRIFISYMAVMILMSVAATCVIKSNLKTHLYSLTILVTAFVFVLFMPTSSFNKNLSLGFYFQTPSDSDVPLKTVNLARKWLWDWFDYDEILQLSMRAEGMVSVFNKKTENTHDRMIAINGRSNSGTRGSDYQGNALLSLFPYLMTQSPKRILIIGLGTGVTAGAIAKQKWVEKVDVCEINAAVSEQLPLFDFATFDASKNRKINIIASDVVKFLLRTDQQYDIIVSIPSNFWTAGIENLMMPEFYSIAQSKLATGGTFIQWIPDYDFSEQGLLTLIKSFNAAFIQSSLWRLTEDDLVLMHQKDTVKSKNWIKQRLSDETFLETMDAINYPNPSQLVLAQIANSKVLTKLSTFGQTHTLNSPKLGALALKALYNPEPDYSAENTIRKHRTL